MKKILILLTIAIFTVSCSKKEDNGDKMVEGSQNTSTQTNLDTNKKENMSFIQTRELQKWDVVAIMKTTNGTIKLRLFTDLVPVTTTNFIGLAKKWYYDDVTFHRVIKDFMIQWGDPDGTGRGGESIYGENFEDEFNLDLRNIAYSISMANAGPNTNGSQFFINQVDNNFLDNKHSVFGQVVEWEDNVDKIAKTKTWANDKPEKDIKIISIEIKEYNGSSFVDYDFDLDATLKEIEEAKAAEKEAKKTKAVEDGDTVSVHYTGTFEDGEKFDSSLDRGEPLGFTVWAGQMIPWFDAGVVWMKIGDKKSLKLSPEMAYWEEEVKISKLQLQSFIDAWIKLEVWEKLPTAQWEIEILKTDELSVTIKNTHPLAWKTLNFDVELVDIK